VNSAAQPQPAYAERAFLADLGKQYVAQGYTFVVEPGPENLPSFLGRYRPDAVALKSGDNVAIEIKQSPHPATERSLKEISRLFDGHDDWHLVVSYMGTDPLKRMTIPAASPEDIRQQIGELQMLASQGQLRAAFVMAWSLLEASLHRIESDEGKRPRTPGTVVQTLAMLGYIEPELEQRVRPLINLRNRIVHGDVGAEPSSEDIQTVLLAVEQALADE
jgi:uncharacterized protein YutE (UPF0331/DUF86 family)